MAEFVTLAPEKLSALREMNPCLMSYNIEFAEVTGMTPLQYKNVTIAVL